MPLVVDSDKRDAYMRALREGDRSALQPLVAGKLAALDALVETELAQLVKEGLVIDQEIFGGDGQVATQKRENPRFAPLHKAMQTLGVDAREQLTTPRSAADAKAAGAVAAGVGLIDRLLSFRQGALAEGDKDSA